MLKRLDLPTLGRPMRASLSVDGVYSVVSLWGVSKLFKIADLRSLIPCPVVAEIRKVWSGLMPRCRNSAPSRLSPRSDLLSRRRTGLRDLRAFLAMSLSLSSGYLELSRASRMRSALSIASEIWS